MRSLQLLGFVLLSSIIIEIAHTDEPTADVSQADTLFRAGRWAEALAEYDRVIPELSGDELAAALRSAGYCQQVRYKHAEAIAYFDRVLAMNEISGDNRAAALLKKGYCLRMMKQGREGIAVLEAGAAVPGASSTTVAECLLFAAYEYRTLGETDAAVATFRKLETVPEVHQNYVAAARLGVGHLLQDAGKYREAIDVYRSIDKLNPVAEVNRARANVFALECEALLAGDNPFHIKPYVMKITPTSARVAWVSQGDVPDGGVTIVGDATVHAPKLTKLPDTICRMHSVVLEGLQPGRAYEYRVSCGGQEVHGSFQTAPGGPAPFTFCVIGDTQSYNPGLQPLLDNMARENAELIVHVGDITDRGDMWGEWKASFFDPGWGYLQKAVFAPAYGNHDGGRYFPLLLDLPKFWYSFDYGDAHFVILDSYGGGAGGPGRAAQLKWLKDDLAANKQKWTFVALHVPMVATSSDVKWFGKDDFLPLLEQHGVDIVFSGHHPHYRRYWPIGRRGESPILHITTGGGGGPIGGSMPSPILAEGVNVNHYTKVHIDGDRLLLTAHAITGDVIDRFEINKQSGPADAAKFGPAVETAEAERIVSTYQALLSDKTYEMQLWTATAPQPGEPTELVLDLARLPRGKIEPSDLPVGTEFIVESATDGAWKIEPQTVSPASGRAVFRAVAPAEASVKDGDVRPAAKVRLRLKLGERTFAPLEATARVRVLSSSR